MGTSKRPGGVPGSGSVTSALEGWRGGEVRKVPAARRDAVRQLASEDAARLGGGGVASDGFCREREGRRVPLGRDRCELTGRPCRGQARDAPCANRLRRPVLAPRCIDANRRDRPTRGRRGDRSGRDAEEGEPEKEEKGHT